MSSFKMTTPIVSGGSGNTIVDHSCKATLNADFGIPDSVDTPIEFNESDENWDTDGYHDDTNKTRFTIPGGLGGKYRFDGQILMETSVATDSAQWLFLFKNGISYAEGYIDKYPSSPLGIFQPTLAINGELLLAEGDYIELGVWHNSGAPLLVLAPYVIFSIRKVS